jgi:tRNA-splicing ligase RtcB
MSKSKLKGKDLRKINYKSDVAKSIAIDLMAKHFKHITKAEKLKILENVLLNPEDYTTHETLAPLAAEWSVYIC